MKPWEDGFDEEQALIAYANEMKAARERLEQAAPDMARALLDLGYAICGEEWHLVICYEHGHGKQCENARAALRKAGVLPGT